MSDDLLGFVLTRGNYHVQVTARQDGGVSLLDMRTLASLDLDGENRDQLRELLDRAAMAGQPQTPGEAGPTEGDHMKPTIGRIVHYVLSAYDAEQVNRRREDFAAFNRANRDAAPEAGSFPGRSGHVGHFGNPVSEGSAYPAVVVATWGTSTANLKVLLDGNDDYWATSRSEGEGPGFWSWPPRS